MLVTKTNVPDQYWLMVLSFPPYNSNILEDAQLFIAMGDVPYPTEYKSVKAKCVELITEVEK